MKYWMHEICSKVIVLLCFFYLYWPVLIDGEMSFHNFSIWQFCIFRRPKLDWKPRLSKVFNSTASQFSSWNRCKYLCSLNDLVWLSCIPNNLSRLSYILLPKFLLKVSLKNRCRGLFGKREEMMGNWDKTLEIKSFREH